MTGGIFDLESLKTRIKTLEEESATEEFWKEREQAEIKLANLKRMQNRYNLWTGISSKYADLNELYKLAIDEEDHSLEKEIRDNLENLEEEYANAKILELMSDRHDKASTFLTIHSGAGGTEACDWVSMLLRMYTRWAERHNYKTEIVDILEVEGGVKSVTMEITGEYAYGYLKTETGIHRLVRISPFDANARRHTSFASVFSSPVIEDDIEVEIKPDEIRVDTYRAGGKGGQHVNKTDSAVRITHLLTGIVVQCQNERSQFKNKSTAMKVLKSRLFDYYQKQKDEEKAKIEDSKKDIAWGNQIRSYVFQPYTLVKDHRTKYEIGNIQAVMDGTIDPFIQEFLKASWTKKE